MNRRGAAAGLALAVLTTGCSSLRTDLGRPLPPDLHALAAGRTHYREVLRQCGPPRVLSALGPGMVFLYEHAAVRERQFGVSLQPLTANNLFKVSVGRARADRAAAVLVFDEAGILRSLEHRQWRDDLGAGGTLQFVVNVVSVVDTRAFDPPHPAHGWGRHLLEPHLAVGLNRANDPDTGQHGLELTATPRGAGQRALAHRPATRSSSRPGAR